MTPDYSMRVQRVLTGECLPMSGGWSDTGPSTWMREARRHSLRVWGPGQQLRIWVGDTVYYPQCSRASAAGVFK